MGYKILSRLCFSVSFVLSWLPSVGQPSAARLQHSLLVDAQENRMEKLSSGVYAIIHPHPTDQWPTSNTGVIIGNNSVLVVDANYLPSISYADIELIKKVTNKPVKYVVYTHWHMDHNNGGIAYKKAFPGVQIVSQKMTAQYISINSPWYAKRETAQNSVKRTSLAQMEEDFERKSDTTGKTFTVEELKKMDTVIRQRKNELDELNKLEIVVPNKTFDITMQIDLGGKIVMIKDWGRCNSPHDATIYLPKEKILFAGDMAVQLPLPFVAESWPVTWAVALEKLEQMPVVKIVPGHGPVLDGNSYIRQLRLLFNETAKQVQFQLSKGVPVDRIASSIDLSHLRKGVWSATGSDADDEWNTTIRTLVDRTVKCIRGQGGVAE